MSEVGDTLWERQQDGDLNSKSQNQGQRQAREMGIPQDRPEIRQVETSPLKDCGGEGSRSACGLQRVSHTVDPHLAGDTFLPGTTSCPSPIPSGAAQPFPSSFPTTAVAEGSLGLPSPGERQGIWAGPAHLGSPTPHAWSHARADTVAF